MTPSTDSASVTSSKGKQATTSSTASVELTPSDGNGATGMIAFWTQATADRTSTRSRSSAYCRPTCRASYSGSGYNLVLTVSSSPGGSDGGSLTLVNVLTSTTPGNGIEQVKFDNGVVWDRAQLYQFAHPN
ncbi:calcium-binding protein [Sphingomonas sp. 66-10]|uniref:calcium-binding protein n=1 Tax=Bacteria TaxID=2 RepID=UPI00339001BC